MDWKQYREHLREEWEFHKRNPIMLFVWAVYITMMVWAIYSS